MSARSAWDEASNRALPNSSAHPPLSAETHLIPDPGRTTLVRASHSGKREVYRGPRPCPEVPKTARGAYFEVDRPEPPPTGLQGSPAAPARTCRRTESRPWNLGTDPRNRLSGAPAGILVESAQVNPGLGGDGYRRNRRLSAPRPAAALDERPAQLAGTRGSWRTRGPPMRLPNVLFSILTPDQATRFDRTIGP